MEHVQRVFIQRVIQPDFFLPKATVGDVSSLILHKKKEVQGNRLQNVSTHAYISRQLCIPAH